jgi:PAS domain S-box-containing protein
MGIKVNGGSSRQDRPTIVIGMSSLTEAASTPPDIREQRILAEQIRLLYANANVSSAVTLCVAAILSYLQWGVISHLIVVGWLTYMVVISSARLALANCYWRGILVPAKTGAWGTAFAMGAGLSAVGWGSAGILLYPKAHLMNQVFLAFVVGGMILGAASILAARPEAFLTFIIPTGTPTVVHFLLQGDDVHFAMGLLSAIFTVATLVAARHTYLTLSLSLNLRFENETLITELQMASQQVGQALRTRGQYLTLAESTARLGVWDCDLRTSRTEISAECARLHGLSPDHPPLTHEDWLGLIHPDDWDRLNALLRESLEQTHIWDAEFRVVWLDGTVHWLLAKGQVYLDDSGQPVRMAGVSLDITQRKQAEAALAESEGRFRNMADSAPVMMWVAGPDKVLTFFNKTWLGFVGRTMEQELNNGWVESVHPDDRDRCFASYASAFDARENFHIEYRLRRSDGAYRWVLCCGVPRFAPGGAFAGYIGSDIDLTDLRRVQEESFAGQKLETLGVLAGGIAHDFNNLLGSILVDAELAEEEVAAGLSPGEHIQRIKAETIRAAEVVRELMIYSGQEKAELEPVDLSRLVEEMLKLLKVSISKHASLKTDLPKDLQPVRGNATQLRQIVMNLIINASEALAEKDGVITVSTSLVAGGQKVTSTGAKGLPGGNSLRLEVSDTGCGMDEAQKARIFDPFFTTKFAGRGLGLAVVHGIVSAHGGTINVVSAPGQGSCFEILLPCASESVSKTGDIVVSAAASEVESLAGTVLLVEDEDILRLTVSKLLRDKGLSVIEAADGNTGVDLFRANAQKIDAVLLDMTIPGMSGQEIFRELRQIQPDVEVIITSAYGRDWVLTALGAAQPWLYVRKPYHISELTGLLRKICLDERKMSGHAAG